ncbi:hypothetical protein BVC71_02860 [Marivivens niveibacter]|uniref:Uncharacterized protein n=1 Tax=Marivivens niveibacter TaxID=1930667 RepID=A0A251X218_9RHOB|nr:HAD hydrolase-like protein [Marivivens niveibacter]OUD10455.1 hypothetical protein BVC71_02860 [Marivivens niveibacter]
MRIDDSQRHAVLCAVQRVLSDQFAGQKFDVTAQVHEADCGNMTLAHVGILSDMAREDRLVLSHLAQALVQACGIDVHLHPMRDVRLLHPDPRDTVPEEISQYELVLQRFIRENWARLMVEAEAYRARRLAEAKRPRAVCFDLVGALLEPLDLSGDTAANNTAFRMSQQGAGLWEAAYAAGLPIAIFANLTEDHLALALAILPAKPAVVVLNGADGRGQPEQTFLAQIVSALRIPRDRILCVGTPATDDLAAARAFGMQTCFAHDALTRLSDLDPDQIGSAR